MPDRPLAPGEVPIRVAWRLDGDGLVPECRRLDVTRQQYVGTQLRAGQELAVEVSTERRCTGYFTSPGEMQPCPSEKSLDSGATCGECADRDLFSAFVRGSESFDDSTHPFFQEPFFVYVVVFGGEPKVGICHTSRYPRRCVEQGADQCRVVCKTPDAGVALSVESEVESQTQIPDRVRSEQKLNALESDSTHADVETAVETIQTETTVDPEDRPVIDLSPHYPGVASVTRPRLPDDGVTRLSGTVTGLRGQWLFTDAGLAVDIGRLEGRLLEPHSQTGLDGF